MIIPVLELIRLEEAFVGTFGILKIQKMIICYILEPRDRENKKNISSIPVQQYLCRRHRSPRFGETFEVIEVPNRTNILFHWGNKEAETEGCLMTGRYVVGSYLNRELRDSKKAFGVFMKVLEGFDLATLSIQEVY